MGDHFGDLLRRPYAPDVLSTFERLQQSRRDPHEFYYKPVPDNENDQHVLECEVFRHRVESEPFSFLVYAERDVTGGTITCRVTASNLSEPVFAEFPIRVEYRDGDATQIAQEMVAQIGRGEDNESRAR